MRYLSLVVLALALSGCQDGFSDAQLKAVEKEISETFQKKPQIRTAKASLVKESKRKLSGFVELVGIDNSEATVSCTAVMDEGERNYIWQCGK